MNASLPTSLRDGILAAVGQAMIATDLTGRVLYWNAAAEKLYGYEAAQAVGRELSDLIIPAPGRAAVADRWARVRDGETFNGDWQLRDKDGRIFTAYLTSTPIRDDSGQVVALLGVSYDVSTRRLLERQARHLAAIVENSDDAIVEIDSDGVIRTVNPAATGITGYEPDELVGRDFELLIPPAERARVEASRAAALAGRSPGILSTKFLRTDGSVVDVAVRLSPVRAEDGSIIGVSALSRDITAELHAKEELAASERMFRARFDQVGLPQASISLSGHFLSVNDALCRLLGRRREELEGAPLHRFHHPSDTGAGEKHIAAMLGGTVDTATWERVLQARDGSAVPVLIHSAVLKDADGTPYGVGTFLHDLRDLRAAEQALRESEARYRAIAETAQEGIWTMDTTGRTLYANDKLAAILGVPREEIYRRPVPELVGAANARMIADRIRTRAARGAEEYEVNYPHPDGGARMLRVSASPLRDDTGHAGSLAMIADVTGARRAERELQRRALRDELTGLANRALLTDRLDRAVSRSARTGSPLAVMMIDLDQFKLINDTWGHEAGDQLLKRVAERLLVVVRAEDSVARFSGDGFVVVCEDTDQDRAMEMADQLVTAFSEPFALDGQRLHVRASVGVAVCPPHSAPDLVRFAEAAMYDAKARGRNRVQLFDAALATESADRLALTNDLRDALVGDELVLHYQPVIDLATGRVRGVEALARWHHPGRGSVSPARFVAVAEATGLAPALDRWALDRVRRDAAALRAAMP
ncbi:PAS domain S-box protein, partial [Planosporangium thailandense]|nr:PAS domain S-box protein [Planosporangium thailandense]